MLLSIALVLLTQLLGGAPAVARAHSDISLVLRDVDIAEAMEMLSKKERVNILLSQGVSGKVSVNLYNVGLKEAITAISNAAGYDVERRGRSYFIVKHDNVGKYVDSGITRVKTFKLQYSEVQDVLPIVKEYLSNYGTIKAMKGRNLLVVEDTPQFLRRISKIVEAVDYQPKQILIEARILEITLDDDESFGIQWQNLFNVNNMSGSSIGTRGLSAGTSGFFFNIAGEDFTAALDALHREGRTKTLSTPKLLTLEDQPASVIVGDRLGYVNTVTINEVTSENTEFLESGVILEVTPSVDNNGRIMLDIHPEVSTGTINDGIPSQTTTSVNTHLLVPDGATSFIGGLIKSQDFDEHSGVPILKDIPFAGRLFSRTEKRKINTEIIVLITPRIVQADRTPWQEREIGKVNKEVSAAEDFFSSE